MQRIVSIIGGGVIGGGWAARFLLNGWNVRVFDPDPEAERKIDAVLDNARRSLPGLRDTALPEEGRMSFYKTMSDTVQNADWIQESVPERLDLKHKIYQAIQEYCDPGAVIGSSTSGFKPSQLQEHARRPEQIVVTHPFNPVYLLPLVEVVTTGKNPPEMIDRAKSHLRGLGMYPLHVRKEIDAHIADRFLEAVWREALWLIKDEVATTEEVDDAIRYGFGLRWAQMGLFETYRLAGGATGMRHFLEQFGPALKWPWTKLMDVPELTDELVDLIAEQSDEQSGKYAIDDLERMRDANLVAIMRALKARNWGAGALLNRHDAGHRLQKNDLNRPLVTVDRVVPLDWTDYNDHMNEARYLQAFSDATDRFMEIIGCDAAYIASGGSYFTAETHLRHLGEIRAGTRIRVETLCLLGKGKKMHLFHRMLADRHLLATGEHLLIHVDLRTRQATPPSQEIAERLGQIAKAHSRLPRPEGIGRTIKPGI